MELAADRKANPDLTLRQDTELASVSVFEVGRYIEWEVDHAE